MLVQRERFPPPEDPDEVLYGRCGTCKTLIQTTRAKSRILAAARVEGRQTNLWPDVPYVECETCKARSPSGNGPRVNLTTKPPAEANS